MKDKKIGIITFHDSRNYGAVLQAYALQKKLSTYFPDTEIIDYQNSEIEKVLKLWSPDGENLKSYIKATFSLIFRKRKKIAFDNFLHQYLRLSPKVNASTIKNSANKYDILITGSDQVWNTSLTDEDMQYFLIFSNDRQKKIAYAASFGDKKIKISPLVKKAISQFDGITLREETMIEEIRKIAHCPVNIACDPTLLLSSSMWKKICSRRLCSKKYVFLFMIDDSKELRHYAQQYANSQNAQLISNKNDINFFLHCSPLDFLSWVLYADCVITNSFHGTVFSILFHKNFVSHLRNHEGIPKNRIIRLLDQMGLSHRNTDNKNLKIGQKENWISIDEKIENMKKTSWAFMDNMLN